MSTPQESALLRIVSAPIESEGDENKYLWSTRVTERTHQELLDHCSQHNLNKAELLRQMLYFVLEYLPKVAKEKGVGLGKLVEANARARAAITEQERRKSAYQEIVDLLSRASSEEHPRLRADLKLAARKKAEAWNIDFPPPGLPLTATDQDAAHVLKYVHKIMSEKQTSAIRLNELNPRIHRFGADELREILARLEENDYLTVYEEHTSGPMTVWISAPTMEVLSVKH